MAIADAYDIFDVYDAYNDDAYGIFYIKGILSHVAHNIFIYFLNKLFF